jgi:hypothetical protein
MEYALSVPRVSVSILVKDEPLKRLLAIARDVGWGNLEYMNLRDCAIKLVNGSSIRVIESPWGEEITLTQHYSGGDIKLVAAPNENANKEMLATLGRRGYLAELKEQVN